MFKMDYKDPKEFFDTTTKDLAVGKAHFTIRKVRTTDDKGYPMTNKSGAEMFSLVMDVIDINGKHGTLIDYMHGNFPQKVHELVNAIGLPELYRPTGFNPATLVGSTGHLYITMRVTEKAPDGLPSVGSYVERQKEFAATQATGFDDEISF